VNAFCRIESVRAETRTPNQRPRFTVSALPRTISPSLGPCPASGGALRASFWLAPCVSNRPCDLPEGKTHDASNRRLPPERFTCTRTSCVPGSLRDFHRVEPHGVLGSVDLPGNRVLHDTRERFSGSKLGTRCHVASLLAYRFAVRELGAWAFSSHGASQTDRASDPSVASCLFRESIGAPSRLLFSVRSDERVAVPR